MVHRLVSLQQTGKGLERLLSAAESDPGDIWLHCFDEEGESRQKVLITH